MLSIFNLDSYKEYLINYYVYECDNNDIKKESRRKLIEQRYSDEYLQEVIDHTKEFILNIIDTCNDDYISIPIAYKEEYIFTNCTGGYHPDVLIPIDDIDKSVMISKHLLNCFLGKKFSVFIDEDEEEYFDESNGLSIGCSYFHPKLLITGDFSKKRKELSQELVRTLKLNN